MRTLLSLVLLLAASPVFAASNRYSDALYVPKSKNQVYDINLQNARFDIGRVSDTTTAGLIYTGAGRILSICTFGGTVGTWSLAYDTITVGSASATPDGTPTLVVSPLVMTQSTDGATAQYAAEGQHGCWTPKYPQPFSTGLVLINSAIDAVTLVLYQKD